MPNLPDNWESWKALSEIIKNSIEAVAVIGVVIGGSFALVRWFAERNDRATTILLELERKFCERAIMKGREYVEDGGRYNFVKKELLQYAVQSSVEGTKPAAASSKAEPQGQPSLEKEIDGCEAIDALLRFYVVLSGVRHAKQVPDASLSTCFRYWLCHYYNPERTEFKEYVDRYYPTLRIWLAKARQKRKFFRPKDFGW
jgi:hypothetical protein